MEKTTIENWEDDDDIPPYENSDIEELSANLSKICSSLYSELKGLIKQKNVEHIKAYLESIEFQQKEIIKRFGSQINTPDYFQFETVKNPTYECASRMVDQIYAMSILFAKHVDFAFSFTIPRDENVNWNINESRKFVIKANNKAKKLKEFFYSATLASDDLYGFDAISPEQLKMHNIPKMQPPISKEDVKKFKQLLEKAIYWQILSNAYQRGSPFDTVRVLGAGKMDSIALVVNKKNIKELYKVLFVAQLTDKFCANTLANLIEIINQPMMKYYGEKTKEYDAKYFHTASSVERIIIDQLKPLLKIANKNELVPSLEYDPQS